MRLLSIARSAPSELDVELDFNLKIFSILKLTHYLIVFEVNQLL